MTIQFPQVDTIEPRLYSDSTAQKNADNSFEEKLKFEQARLGLLFSPFSQLESFFLSTLNPAEFKPAVPEPETTEPAEQFSLKQNYSNQLDSKSNLAAPGVRLFDSLPLQPLNRQFLQKLLSQTNWLVPNLESQPLFAQARLEGKLQPKFDLQFLIDQIIESVNLIKRKGQTELSMNFKPEDLGEILLTLISRSGVVSIQIQASAETKKLIDSRRQELELALKKSHLIFDKITVEEVEHA